MVIKQGKLFEFDEYQEFTDKFKPKKTTDDCYTPAEVYECVKGWVNSNICDLTGKKIVRPFKPGGDYLKDMESYDANTVVIDNPPFSILSKIKKDYCRNGVKYFLFAPHLTLFSSYCNTETYIVTNSSITYANGAVVATDFVTNMAESDVGVIVDASLNKEIQSIQREERKHPARYRYPSNVLSSTSWDTIISAMPDYRTRINKNEMMFVRRLDRQAERGKAIFGGGFLVSDAAGRENEEARKEAEEARKEAEEARTEIWELSYGEHMIVENLNKEE